LILKRDFLMSVHLDPRGGKKLCLLNHDGTEHPDTKSYPRVTDQQALEAYRIMVVARYADEWAVSLNRQGRMATYPPNKGQEANPVGAIMALRSDDWFVPSYRELGGYIARGIPLEHVLLYWYGNEWGNYLPIDKYHTLPVSVPVGSQPIHAVGIARAEQYMRSERVVISFMGDGATSEGDATEAFNFAGVWKTPVIFYVQNNQWAISLPRTRQTASKTLAEKASAFGFEGIQVDGNDVFAVYAAVSLAAEKARKGDGPTLIEGVTYRLGPHTTSDDPSRYRDDSEVRDWVLKDPIVRLEKYLTGKKLLTEKDAKVIRGKALDTAKSAFKKVESYKRPQLEETYRYTFHTMPAVLKKQLERRRQQ
jgi:pyruvate dehydrogenase E1 component alpha subunit